MTFRSTAKKRFLRYWKDSIVSRNSLKKPPSSRKKIEKILGMGCQTIKGRTDTIQIPLFGAIRIKKKSLTSHEIKQLKLRLYRERAKILGIIIKPTKREDKR